MNPMVSARDSCRKLTGASLTQLNEDSAVYSIYGGMFRCSAIQMVENLGSVHGKCDQPIEDNQSVQLLTYAFVVYVQLLPVL